MQNVLVNYLSMLKISASPPRVVKRSLYRSPCGVRSLSDRLPRLPWKARSPSKIMLRKNDVNNSGQMNIITACY